MSLSEILEGASNLSDLTIGVVAILLVVWLVGKFLDKQQEQTLLHNEQMDKTFKIIASFTETLSELVALIREGNEKTDNVSDKVDEINRKLENNFNQQQQKGIEINKPASIKKADKKNKTEKGNNDKE